VGQAGGGRADSRANEIPGLGCVPSARRFNLPGGTPEPADVNLLGTLERECVEESQVRISNAVPVGYQLVDEHGVVYAPAAAGLLSFAPGACEPPPDGLRFAGGMSFFLAPLLAFALFLYLYARHRRRGGPKRLTYEELRKQDMVTERERMLELEDSILGPVNQEWRPEA